MSVWLTRIQADPRNGEVRRDLRDAVQLHRRVMSLLPDNIGDHARQQCGALYRLDDTDTGPAILVQTQRAPDLQRLPTGYGTARTLDMSTFIKSLTNGTLVHYRIAANASKRIAVAQGNHRVGQVVALNGVEADEWWQRQAESHGLLLLSARAQRLTTMHGQRRDDQRVRHALTRFDGTARVRDADKVRDAVLNGIGRGKSYGCGLLSLAPARVGDTQQ